jgi:hypothetical protein
MDMALTGPEGTYWRPAFCGVAKQVLSISWVLYTARFSEAFLTLRAVEVGLPVAFVPGLLVISQLLQTGLSYPLGRWADSFLDRHVVLLSGFLCLGAANVCCLFATSPMHMVGGKPPR